MPANRQRQTTSNSGADTSVSKTTRASTGKQSSARTASQSGKGTKTSKESRIGSSKRTSSQKQHRAGTQSSERSAASLGSQSSKSTQKEDGTTTTKRPTVTRSTTQNAVGQTSEAHEDVGFAFSITFKVKTGRLAD
jgi:hypothetical protein